MRGKTVNFSAEINRHKTAGKLGGGRERSGNCSTCIAQTTRRVGCRTCRRGRNRQQEPSGTCQPLPFLNALH